MTCITCACALAAAVPIIACADGEPGERKYHRGYYAAYLLDPDGNTVEAVHHGPARRSAEAIEVTPTG